MTSSLMPSRPLLLLILCLAVGFVACSEAGLHKADGRTLYADTLSKDNPDKCVSKAVAKGKRELTYTCTTKTIAETEKSAAALCSSLQKVGFETLTLKAQDGERTCEVHNSCACKTL